MQSDPDDRTLAARVLPQGSKRRQVARVGAQIAKDARAYRGRLSEIVAAAKDGTVTESGSPDDPAAYAAWLAAHRATPAVLEKQRQWSTDHPDALRIDVVIDEEQVGTDPEARRRTRASLDAQSFGDWHVIDAANVHQGPEDAFILFLLAGDVLEPDALHHLATRVWDDPALELVTWDDDVWTGENSSVNPQFRCGWTPDGLLGSDLIGRACALRRTALPLAHRAGLDPARRDARWWDLLLRLGADGEPQAAHVPRILSHLARRPEPGVHEAVRTVQDHLDRSGRSGQAHMDGRTVRIRWTPPHPRTASILIPTRHNRALIGPCLASIARTTTDRAGVVSSFEVIVIDNGACTPANEAWYDEQREALGLDLTVRWWTEPFNYSKVNNEAARHATGDVLVFLNDDTEALDPGWLAELTGWAIQPGIGLVGTHLIAPDGTLQHAGVVLGMSGYADHLFEGLPPDTTTLFGPTRTYRNFASVTGACAAIARAHFDELGGLDERFELCGSDVKLGVDAINHGLRNVCTPFAAVAHKESATRGTEVPDCDFFTSWWPYEPWIRGGDPYFSPNLSLWSRTPRLRAEDEPSPLELIGALIHRPLAPKVGAVTWDEAAHTSWLVERCNADESTRASIAEGRRAHAGAHPPSTIAWWIPDLESPFYGGVNTAFRLAEHLQRTHDVESSFVVAGDANEWFVRSAIAAAFPTLADASITFIDTPDDAAQAPAVDVGIATLWETAYLLAHAPAARRKAYLVQDYEPGFYPAGVKSALASESYRLGLTTIANTEHVLDVIRPALAAPACSFQPAIDPAIFHPVADRARRATHRERPAHGDTPTRGDRPVTVFVYARPGHPRNCWELAEAALIEVKTRFGRGVRIVTAGSWATPDQLGGGIRHLGFLDYASTGDLYRSCDIGLTLQVSEHPSYLPLELLACGVPVVAFDHPSGDWLLRHEENSLRCLRTKDGLVEALDRLIRDEPLRERLGRQGAADIADRHGSWDAAFAGIYSFLSDPEGTGSLK